MSLEKVFMPLVNVNEYPWLKIVIILFFYVFIRALFLQGGLYLFVKKAKLALAKRVYLLPFSANQLSSEFKAGLVTILADAILIATLIKIGPPLNSQGSIAFSFLVNFIWFEIWFYISHRLLHTRSLYFIHKQHHVAKVTSPLTALSFSVFERIIIISGSLGFIVLISFFLPISPLGTALYLLVNYVLNLFAHMNVELVSPQILKNPLGRILNTPTYHALHHGRYNGHYGLFTPFMDRLFNSQFNDYQEVQLKSYKGQGLTSFSQRLQPQTPVVLITGASAGIGEALAYTYARDGYRVVLCARRLEKLEKISADIQSMGGESFALACDVRNRADMDLSVRATVEKFGRLDVVIANAGFGVYGDFEKLTTEDFQRQFDTNVYGVINTVQASLPAIKRTQGRIAVVGSAYSYLSFPSVSPYAMSKYAVRALTESLYFELKPQGVSVTLICPGVIGTDFRKIDSNGKPKLDAKEPLPAIIVMDPKTAARQMKKAIDRRKAEAVITFHGKVGVMLKNYLPCIYNFIIYKFRTRINNIVIKKLMDAT